MEKKAQHNASPLLIIGGGHMGFALAKGLSDNPLILVEPSDDRRNWLATENLPAVASLDALRDDFIPRAILLSIKPQSLTAAAPALRDYIARINAASHHLPLLISILAGVSIETLQANLMPHIPVIRAMPNTPALIKRGISACYASASVGQNDRLLASDILSCVGEVVWLDSEADINSATAISGSGPAYVFYFIESLIAAAQEQGLSEEVAEQLARATIAGSVALSEHMDIALAQLRKNVTSPNGTTEAGLSILMDENNGLAPLMIRTVARAKQRADFLAESL